MANLFLTIYHRYRSDLKQFTRFGIVGGLNTLVDFGLFSFLYFFCGTHYMISQILAYAVATCHSYVWNRYWTFQAKYRPEIAEFAKFVTVNILSLGVSLIALYLFREIIGLSTIISKIIATLFAMTVNYSLNRFWVFCRKLKTNDQLDKHL